MGCGPSASSKTATPPIKRSVHRDNSDHFDVKRNHSHHEQRIDSAAYKQSKTNFSADRAMPQKSATKIDDKDFDNVAQILFKNVPSMRTIGCPGTLIPVTTDTRAVICDESSENVIVAAARIGLGRCLVFAHSGYPYMFLENEPDDSKFIENCRQWLARGSYAKFISIEEAYSFNDVTSNDSILVWNGERIKNPEFMRSLCRYLEQGGGLVCGATPWGWLQLNPGKSLLDLPFYHFCNDIGIRLVDNYSNCRNPMPFRAESIQFKNAHHAVQKLVKNPSDCESLAVVGSLCRELGDAAISLPMESLRHILMNARSEVIPTKNSPVRDRSCRQMSNGMCGILCALDGIKAPGIKQFPGDFDQLPPLEKKVKCRIETKETEWYCTGYYVVAGIPIQIDLDETQVKNGWWARIGCHNDSIANCDELRRWSCISIRKQLIGSSITMSSAFGGLLFLECPDNQHHSITLHLHNVIRAPTYNIKDSNRRTRWERECQNAPGLWADIAGDHIVFNMPSASVVHLGSNDLDGILKFWDDVVLAHHEIRGTKPEHRQRIVCDEQISCGYMHSGYPIMTHLDVCNPKADGFIFNQMNLRKQGCWGLFHELGHNMQRDWWTFNGTGEVTVNIFTLHAMDTVCHLKPWIHTWLQDQKANTIKYIQNGSDFNQWKNDPGIALYIYAQLAREYGWNSYKTVFRIYEETKPHLESDQEKIDHWIKTFSEVVGYNLIPLFKFWGFPISSSTVDSLQHLDTPKITDEFIKLAPERYHM